MTRYLGDFATGKTIPLHFSTHAANGAPIAPSAAFVAADFRIYKDASDTQRSSSAGVSVVSPFDSVTGRHCVSIDTSNNTDAGFFAAGHDYRVEINSGKTVDGVSQSGVEIGSFSIQNRYAPTVSGGLDAAGVRAAIGMATANLDTQLAGLPAAVESAIINEGDATALLEAIADKIAAENPSLGDLTLAAIASAVWANSTRTLSAGVALSTLERETLVAAIEAELSLVNEESLEAIAETILEVIGGIRAQVLGAIVLGAGERIQITQGNDYLERSGNSILLEIERPGVDFTGASAELAFGKVEGNPLVTVDAAVEDAAVGSCSVRVELRQANTSLPSGQYRYDVRIFRPEAEMPDETITVVDGEWVIRPAAGAVEFE